MEIKAVRRGIIEESERPLALEDDGVLFIDIPREASRQFASKLLGGNAVGTHRSVPPETEGTPIHQEKERERVVQMEVKQPWPQTPERSFRRHICNCVGRKREVDYITFPATLKNRARTPVFHLFRPRGVRFPSENPARFAWFRFEKEKKLDEFYSQERILITRGRIDLMRDGCYFLRVIIQITQVTVTS